MFASPTGARVRFGSVATLVALVLCVLCVSFSVVGLAAGASATTPAASEAGNATSPETAPIADALEDADGTVAVLVRLEPFDDTTVSSADRNGDENATVAARRAHAERTQTALERYASTTEGVAVERSFWIANAALVSVDTDRASLEALARLENVTAVEPDTTVSSSAAAVPSGPDASANGSSPPNAELAAVGAGTTSSAYTPGLETLRVPEAWETFRTRGEGVRIAVLDSGVDGNHPDIDVAEWKDFDENPSPEPVDYDGHGTQVSGIAVGGNASGTHIGVAPDATLLHGAVMTDCEGRKRCGGRSSIILSGMEWALESGADVISLSLGWDGHSSASVAALENAREAGTVVVGAVGNGGEGTSLSPGNAYDVISVGAVDGSNDVAGFSGGEEIDTADEWHGDAPARWPDSYVVPDVVAPGVRVESATPGGGYRTSRGTSLTAPHVAGTVALMESATAADLAPDEIRRALEETAWKPDGESAAKDVRYGSGIVDAVAAIQESGDHATLEGTVIDTETGAPLSNATVRIIDDVDDETIRTTTDADGRYAVRGLAGDREYTVLVERAGYDSATATQYVPAGEATTLDVALAGSGTITVDVTDAHFGEGVETATVEADTTGANGTYVGTHVGDGTYRLENVPTGVDYELRVGADGYVNEERSVSLADGDMRAESVQLRGDAALAVTVETADGEPIPNATVVVERDAETMFTASSRTTADEPLEVAVPGTGESYAVEASAPEFEPAAVETPPVESGETVPVTVSIAAPIPPTVFAVFGVIISLCGVVGGVQLWRRYRES